LAVTTTSGTTFPDVGACWARAAVERTARLAAAIRMDAERIDKIPCTKINRRIVVMI
jgi:hypothetical protein